MTYDEAIAVFGTQVNLAAALGITQSTISSSWGSGERDRRVFVIPPKYQYQLEVITRRRLLADAELRAPARIAPDEASRSVA